MASSKPRSWKGTPVRVLLGGEGSTELGDWCKEPPYRPARAAFEVGVIEALLKRAAPANWSVEDGVLWKKIRKYQVCGPGQPRRAEARNVLGLALLANEQGFDVLAFVRDRDGDVERQQDVRTGIDQA